MDTRRSNMNTSTSRQLAKLAVFTCALLPSLSFATNGYFLIGYGAKSRAMGGVGIGYAQDGTAAAVNPAGLADVGTRADVYAALFIPRRSAACCLSPDGVVSGSNLFLIPTMAGAFKFNRTLSFGFAAVGAGANTRYAQNFYFDDPTLPGAQADSSGGALGVQLIQMVMAPSVSYNLNRDHSVGLSMLIGAQTFRAYGLDQAFARFSLHPDHMTNNGNDWSFGGGARIGWRGKFLDEKLTLGATYASKVYMSKFDKYKGLFADEGGFDIPENYGVGLAVKVTDKLTLALDVMQINYSDVAAVGNPSLPISSAADNTVDKLGHPDGPGFGWSDQTVYKLGLAYDLNSKWTLRAGLNYGETPISEDDSLEFNVLAPATTEQHYTFGASYRISPNHQVDFAYTHARRNELSTVVAPDTQLPFSGPISTEMFINTFDFGYSFSF